MPPPPLLRCAAASGHQRCRCGGPRAPPPPTTSIPPLPCSRTPSQNPNPSRIGRPRLDLLRQPVCHTATSTLRLASPLCRERGSCSRHADPLLPLRAPWPRSRTLACSRGGSLTLVHLSHAEEAVAPRPATLPSASIPRRRRSSDPRVKHQPEVRVAGARRPPRPTLAPLHDSVLATISRARRPIRSLRRRIQGRVRSRAYRRALAAAVSLSTAPSLDIRRLSLESPCP